MKTCVLKTGRDKLSLEDHLALAAAIQTAEQSLTRMCILVSGKLRAPVLDRLIKMNHELYASAAAMRDYLYDQMVFDHPGDPRIAGLYYGGSPPIAPVTPTDEQGLPIALVTADGYPIALVTLVRHEWGHQWRIDDCPYCHKKHLHGGGYLGKDPRRFLGHRVEHCAGNCNPKAIGYVLVEAEPRV